MKTNINNYTIIENTTSLLPFSSGGKNHEMEVGHYNVIAIVASVFLVCLIIFILLFKLKKNKNKENIKGMTVNEIYACGSFSHLKTNQNNQIKLNEIYNSMDLQTSSLKDQAVKNVGENVRNDVYSTIDEADKETKSLNYRAEEAENISIEGEPVVFDNFSQQNAFPVYAVVNKKPA